jgi:hypothetical protein
MGAEIPSITVGDGQPRVNQPALMECVGGVRRTECHVDEGVGYFAAMGERDRVQGAN